MTRARSALKLLVLCMVLGLGLGGLAGIATAPLAHADNPIGDGSLVGDTLSVGASVVDDGRQAASNLATGGSSGNGGGEPSPYATTRHYYGDHNDPGWGVNSPFPCPSNPDGSQQPAYIDVTIDTRTGAETGRTSGCEAPGQARPAADQPAPPPDPPTAAEMLAATPIPRPAPGIKGTTGLTGAETWAWDDSAGGPVSVTVVIRGYTATSTAGPQSWRWDMASSGPESHTNPPSVFTSSSPGSASDPAVRFRYSTRGNYQITVEVTWGGSFTFSGNGQSSQTRSLGTTTRTATIPYHVIQSYGVLVAS